MCPVCNGVGVLYTHGTNPYSYENEPGTNKELAKNY